MRRAPRGVGRVARDAGLLARREPAQRSSGDPRRGAATSSGSVDSPRTYATKPVHSESTAPDSSDIRSMGADEPEPRSRAGSRPSTTRFRDVGSPGRRDPPAQLPSGSGRARRTRSPRGTTETSDSLVCGDDACRRPCRQAPTGRVARSPSSAAPPERRSRPGRRATRCRDGPRHRAVRDDRQLSPERDTRQVRVGREHPKCDEELRPLRRPPGRRTGSDGRRACTLPNGRDEPDEQCEPESRRCRSSTETTEPARCRQVEPPDCRLGGGQHDEGRDPGAERHGDGATGSPAPAERAQRPGRE